MTDVLAAFRTFLVGQVPLTTYFIGGIIAGSEPPSGYLPERGPLLLFQIRSSFFSDQSENVMDCSMLIHLYGATPGVVYQALQLLNNTIHGKMCPPLLRVSLDHVGVMVFKEETKWPVHTTWYNVIVRMV